MDSFKTHTEANIFTLYEALAHTRFLFSNEKEVQRSIASVLTERGIAYTREEELDEQNIPDFMVGAIAVEVKIKGRVKDIYKQLERYSMSEKVSAIILVTGKATGMPKEINSKPVYVINISRAWM